MAYWNNSATEIDKMTVKQFLDYLTDNNWHTERMVVEAIIDGREDVMAKARLIWEGHNIYGYMPNALCDLRNELYKEMNEE